MKSKKKKFSGIGVCESCGEPMVGIGECSDCAFPLLTKARDAAARAVEDGYFERTGKRKECGEILRESLDNMWDEARKIREAKECKRKRKR